MDISINLDIIMIDFINKNIDIFNKEEEMNIEEMNIKEEKNILVEIINRDITMIGDL
jgi:hypothetical protein